MGHRFNYISTSMSNLLLHLPKSHVILELTKKTWTTFSCSPLHHFSKKSSNFEFYSEALSAVLVAHMQSKTVVGLEDVVGIKASFKLMDGIAVSRNDHSAVQLTVLSKDGRRVAEMIMCSVGADSLWDDRCDVFRRATRTSLEAAFAVLPLLLFKGNLSTRNFIFEWIKTEFDCNITRLPFNPLSLGWMLGMWCCVSTEENKRKSTQIVWKIPIEDIGLNYIESTFSQESIEVLWEACHKRSNNIVTLEEVEKFVNGLEEHLAKHFRIKFAALPLEQVHMPTVHVHGDGKIKIFSHVRMVLNHLTELALEKMTWALPVQEELI